jgi:hypothetical protein
MLRSEFNMNRTQFDLLFDALVMKEMAVYHRHVRRRMARLVLYLEQRVMFHQYLERIGLERSSCAIPAPVIVAPVVCAVKVFEEGELVVAGHGWPLRLALFRSRVVLVAVELAGGGKLLERKVIRILRVRLNCWTDGP